MSLKKEGVLTYREPGQIPLDQIVGEIIPRSSANRRASSFLSPAVTQARLVPIIY